MHLPAPAGTQLIEKHMKEEEETELPAFEKVH